MRSCFSDSASDGRIIVIMDLVMDIQFCKDANDKNVPKEVAILALNKDFSAHWMVLPPYTIKKLPSKVRCQNNWLMQNHHGLTWMDGDISQRTLQKNLETISRYGNKIYVRGREKLIFLQGIIHNEIINLEDDNNCPSFENLSSIGKHCLQHAIKSPLLSLHCAINNAGKLKFWLNQMKTLEDNNIEILLSLENLDDEQLRNFTNNSQSSLPVYGGISK